LQSSVNKVMTPNISLGRRKKWFFCSTTQLDKILILAVWRNFGVNRPLRFLKLMTYSSCMYCVRWSLNYQMTSAFRKRALSNKRQLLLKVFCQKWQIVFQQFMNAKIIPTLISKYLAESCQSRNT
jgi:hypothetical protein